MQKKDELAKEHICTQPEETDSTELTFDEYERRSRAPASGTAGLTLDEYERRYKEMLEVDRG